MVDIVIQCVRKDKLNHPNHAGDIMRSIRIWLEAIYAGREAYLLALKGYQQ